MKKTEKRGWRERFANRFDSLVLPLLFIGLVILFSVLSPAFRTTFNLVSSLRFTSFIAIGAIGMAFCIMNGDFDISVGSMLSLVAVIGSSLLPVIGGVPAVLFTLVFSSFLGFTNGVFITKLRIPAFITTLGTMFIFRSLAYIYTNNTPVYIENRFWLYLGNGKVAGIPFAIVLMLFCYAVAWLVLRKSPFGRYVIAVGTNRNAAVLSGINVDRVKIIVFTLVGLFVGIASVVISANLGSANPGMLGQGYEFQVITAVVLGGTVLGGGNGNLWGAFFASMIITYLKNGLGLEQVDSYWQFVAVGLVLIFAVAMNRIKFTVLGQKEV
jgi:ribose/xylose/arabinose/galactoside ABC-type transport system permease subunit